MELLFLLLGISLVINITMFLVAFRYKTDRLTDISYAVSFITLVVYATQTDNISVERAIVCGMVLLWALRLGTFLLIRIWKTGIDHRFDAMRNNFWQFGKFWVLQAVSVWIILIPSLLALTRPEVKFTALSYVGISIWLAGLLLEATADLQKSRFSHNPSNKNKWIESGVWKYSRHPNYMGEILVWTGIYVAVVPSLSISQAGLGLISPFFIISLLLLVSGIPPLEKAADEKWGDDPKYQAYKQRTSRLIPWLPKK